MYLPPDDQDFSVSTQQAVAYYKQWLADLCNISSVNIIYISFTTDSEWLIYTGYGQTKNEAHGKNLHAVAQEFVRRATKSGELNALPAPIIKKVVPATPIAEAEAEPVMPTEEIII